MLDRYGCGVGNSLFTRAKFGLWNQGCCAVDARAGIICSAALTSFAVSVLGILREGTASTGAKRRACEAR